MAGSVPAHVWVRSGAREDPGLLLQWQRRGVEWWGLVAIVVDGEPIIQAVRGDLLRPARRRLDGLAWRSLDQLRL